jgi:hypothetical protein
MCVRVYRLLCDSDSNGSLLSYVSIQVQMKRAMKFAGEYSVEAKWYSRRNDNVCVEARGRNVGLFV